MILVEARKHPEIPYKNIKLMLFPEFSAEVQNHRRSFNEVRRHLQEKNIKYGMLYPSRLRIPHKGTVCFFDTPEEANEWIDTL